MLRDLSLRWDRPSLLVVDEASRVKDTIWATISPMLAAAPGARQALVSTPAGASGEFHRVERQKITLKKAAASGGVVATALAAPRHAGSTWLVRSKARRAV
jgi:hypothetical protein